MNKIETLIQELCPNGVEKKELSQISRLTRGKVMSKQFLEENSGDFPVYSSQTRNRGEIGKISTYDFDGEYITWTTDGANAGTVFYRNGKFSITNVCGLIDITDNNLSIKYLYYILSISTKKYVSSGMGNPKLMSNVVGKIKIPIPPLEIQEEIVKILDKFTDYVTELTTELTLRQKQYNYYRDKLFTFEGEEVEWKTLGEIATIQRGASPRPISKFLTDNEDGVPWIKIGDTNVNSKFVENTNQKITKEGAKKSRLLKKGDFILSNSMSFGRPYILKIDGAIHDGWASISDFEDFVISDYLYHYLVLNKTQQYWASKINSGSVSNLNSEIIKSLNVPIPSFEVQLKIVKFLDYFNELTSNLSEGLPKEIGLRQKQYEYYRDKLLSFD